MQIPRIRACLIGYLIGTSFAAYRARSAPPLPGPWVSVWSDPRAPTAAIGTPADTRLGSGSTPREWRAVPGIGPRLALALARARWRAGRADFDPQEVRGIGIARAQLLSGVFPRAPRYGSLRSPAPPGPYTLPSHGLRSPKEGSHSP